MSPPAELDRKTFLRLALLSVLAMLFSTLVYKYTLRAWFMQDDFAWLGLRFQVHSAQDLWHALFAPMAQGTIRPLSERAFFMGFSSIFGLHALPYRIMVYVTQLVNIALLTAVAWWLTRSLVASFVAPILWVANVALAQPMTWTSAYNEILCSSCFLLSFYGLVRYTQTGNWRFNVLQWASFLIGFGVLEIIVTYPAIAILYTIVCARPFVKRTLPLLIPSVLFTIIHTAVRSGPGNSVYVLYVDGSMFRTLVTYWNRALGAVVAAEAFVDWEFYPVIVTVLLTASIALFVAWRVWRGDRMPVFFLGWFVIALAPFLPIRDHVSDYYLTVPVIGLALLGGWAAAIGWGSNWGYRAATLALIAVYLVCSVPATRKLSRILWARSMPVKKLVLGVAKAHERDPEKTILVEGVDRTLFWTGFYDHPFRLVGAERVFLTPDTTRKIPSEPELAKISDYSMPESEMVAGLAHDEIVVYGLEGGDLHEITPEFKAATLDKTVPRHVQMGRPIMESLLDKNWYPPEGDFRWMPKTATIHMGMPATGRGEVDIEAFCTPIQLKAGPIVVTVSVEGTRSNPWEIRDCKGPVGMTFPFTIAAGRQEADVNIEVNRTIHVGFDKRDLGLAVRNVEVKPRP